MVPEEKMAARLLVRAGLQPPFDLRRLAEQYANVEYLPFPVDSDGVTIGLGGAALPQVLINSSKPKTRQRFTLAHELGHVLIPWHTGIIASHICDGDGGDVDYLVMEGEANRFASELLIPSAWIKSKFTEGDSFAKAFGDALEAVGTSRDAFLIKLFNTLEHPIYCAQVAPNGTLTKVHRCGGASYGNLDRLQVADKAFSQQAVDREEFKSGDRDYVVWSFKEVSISESDERPWRDVLSQIADDTGTKHLIPSINAILPGQVNDNKDLSVDAICAKVMLNYQGRPRISAVVCHPLFGQYIIKRVIELKNRRR